LNFDAMPTVYNAVKEIPAQDEESALKPPSLLSEPLTAKKSFVIAVGGFFP
jgi:hypothetical protein